MYLAVTILVGILMDISKEEEEGEEFPEEKHNKESDSNVEEEEDDDDNDSDQDSYDDDGIVKLITKKMFKDMCDQQHFTKVYKDARSTVNRLVLGLLNKAVAKSMIIADDDNGRRELTREDAISALKDIREFPDTFE